MPRAAKLTAIIGAVVIAFAAFVWFLAVRTGAAKEYVVGRIESAARGQGLILQIRNMGIALFGPAVTLNDIVVRTEAAPDLPPMLRAKTVRLNLGLGALLSGRYGLSEVVVEDPQVDVAITEQGRSNLPAAARGGGTKGRQVGIPRLRATGGSLRIDDRRERIFALLPKWQLSLKPNAETTQAGVVFETGAPGTISVDDRKILVSELALDSIARQNGAEIRKLDVATQAGRVSATGSASWVAGAPVLSLHGDMALLLPQLTAFARLPLARSGEVNGPFTAAGPLDQLRIQADLRGAAFPLLGFERAVMRADATYLRERKRIEVHSLAVSSPAADFTAKGALALRAAQPSSIRADVSRINLQQLSAIAASPYILASRGAGTVSAEWPGLAFRRANGRADLQLTAVLPGPVRKVLPASGPVSVTSRDGQTRLSSTALSALSAQWNADVTVAPSGGLSGVVHGQTADAGRLLAEVNAFRGGVQPLVPANVSGAASFAANLGGTTKRPQAQLNVRAPSLRVGRIENANLTARALYTPEQINVQQADLQWMGQKVSLQGNIGLQGAAAALDLNARAQGTAAGALFGANAVLGAIPGLSAEIPAMPQVAVQAHIGGTSAQPKVTLTGAAPVVSGD